MLYTRRPWFGASVRCSVRLCFCFGSLLDCIDAPTVVRAEVGPEEPDSDAVGAVRARKKKITLCGIQWKSAHCQNFIRMFQLCSDWTLAWRGDWKRETWHRETVQLGTISQGSTSRDLFHCESRSSLQVNICCREYYMSCASVACV